MKTKNTQKPQKTKNTNQKPQSAANAAGRKSMYAGPAPAYGSGDKHDRLEGKEQFKEWNQMPLHDADTFNHPDFVIDGC